MPRYIKNSKFLEIFYCTAPLIKPEEKTFFVKLYLNKKGNDYVVDFKRFSSELKTEQDIEEC